MLKIFISRGSHFSIDKFSHAMHDIRKMFPLIFNLHVEFLENVYAYILLHGKFHGKNVSYMVIQPSRAVARPENVLLIHKQESQLASNDGARQTKLFMSVN